MLNDLSYNKYSDTFGTDKIVYPEKNEAIDVSEVAENSALYQQSQEENNMRMHNSMKKPMQNSTQKKMEGSAYPYGADACINSNSDFMRDEYAYRGYGYCAGAEAPLCPVKPNILPPPSLLDVPESLDCEKLPEAYTEAIYTPAFFRKHIGQWMRIDFLAGMSLMCRAGRLDEVGVDFIVLSVMPDGFKLYCDINTIKFALISEK